jgi:large subunit ribosomal protein L6
MTSKIKNFNVKIPIDIKIIYNEKKETLTLKGPLVQRSIKLKLKVFIDTKKELISVSPVTFSSVSNKEKRNIKTLRNTTVALIKHMIIETSILVYKKLKINGVGYRASFTESFSDKLLSLKLGYSHFVYFKVPNNLTITCPTRTKLCVFGNSYQDVSHISALIRSNKLPEPYKGKGILYEDETVILKEGKKV